MAPDLENLRRELGAAVLPDARHDEASRGRGAAGRRARFVAILSPLAGAGRTTLAANLAVTLGRAGVSTAVFELGGGDVLAEHFRVPDRGEGLAWMEPCVGLLRSRAAPALALQQAMAHCDVVLLDAPAPPSPELDLAAANADEVLAVVRPDEAALHAVARMDALLLRTRLNDWRRSPARYVVNRFDGRRRADRDAARALRERLGARLLAPFVQEDSAVSAARAARSCVQDFAPGSQVVADLQALAKMLEVGLLAERRMGEWR